MEQFQVNTKFLNSLPPEWSKFVTDVKLVKDLHTSNYDQFHAYLEQHELHENEVRDDPITCLNKAMAFLTVVASLREILLVDKQGLLNATVVKVTDIWLDNAHSLSDQRMLHGIRRKQSSQAQTIIPHNVAFQTEDLDTYDSDCDDLSTTQSFLMANISNYGSGVISETKDLNTYDSDCDDLSNAQMVHMANISNYGSDVILEEKANKEQYQESITAELERYKERVKTFKQHLNIDLSCRGKIIDSQIDDMIREKLALKEKVDSLEQNLSKQITKTECLLETLNVFKNKSKEKENKFMETKIDLEYKIKELNNIVFKVGQSAQTVHMLTKPQSFYNNVHKQALGYQNLFYLKKAQWMKPTLYDGIVISEKHVAMPMIDNEETLILEEES
uniref:Gag-Pol polyprotein n=1 Tax=Tanacetum cinerariifolium TaxID=118510 RepID=A0A6L2NS74_TANCI|nr:Gag-Pol polyprotein [Tanacetum cinerariifolium]